VSTRPPPASRRLGSDHRIGGLAVGDEQVRDGLGLVDGMAKPTPMLPVCWSLLPRVRMAELMPITRAWASTSGPPGAARVDRRVGLHTVDEGERRVGVAVGLHHHGRSTAETMPWLTESDRPSGRAEASTGSPIRMASESPV
jgi:hypothetical protein